MDGDKVDEKANQTCVASSLSTRSSGQVLVPHLNSFTNSLFNPSMKLFKYSSTSGMLPAGRHWYSS